MTIHRIAALSFGITLVLIVFAIAQGNVGAAAIAASGIFLGSVISSTATEAGWIGVPRKENRGSSHRSTQPDLSEGV